MKRLFVIISLILALSICFSACGDKTPTESTSESLTERTESESASGSNQESDSSSIEGATETSAATDGDSSEENSSSTETDYDVETESNKTDSEITDITTDGEESRTETESNSTIESGSDVTEGTEETEETVETEDPRLSAEYAPVLYFSAKDIYNIAREYVDGWKMGSGYLDDCQLLDNGKTAKLITHTGTVEAFLPLLTSPAEAAPYVAIKYRTTTANILMQMFIDSENLSVQGSSVTDFSVSSSGEWETLIVDLTSKIAKYDGEVANYIRFDFLNSPAQKLQSGDYIEIEYIGFFKSEADFAKFEGIKTKYDYALIDPESEYSISSGIAHGAYLDVVRVMDADGNIVKQLTPGVCANSADNRFLVPVRKEASSLDMNGWAVVDGGISGYKWSADGGKTWHDVQLVGASAFNNVGQAHLEAVALYLENDKSQYLNIFSDLEASKVGGGFQHASIRINLGAYSGQTVDVVFAAVSAEDQSTLCPLAIFADITVIE